MTQSDAPHMLRPRWGEGHCLPPTQRRKGMPSFRKHQSPPTARYTIDSPTTDQLPLLSLALPTPAEVTPQFPEAFFEFYLDTGLYTNPGLPAWILCEGSVSSACRLRPTHTHVSPAEAGSCFFQHRAPEASTKLCFRSVVFSFLHATAVREYAGQDARLCYLQ